MKLVVACPDQCSFHPDKIGPGITAALLSMREQGAGAIVFKRRAEELLHHPVPGTNVQRHLKHYKPVEDNPGGIIDPSKKLADLEILDLVIQRGAQNSANWKPSIKDTIEAMKLKMQMTGNSAFDDLLSLLDSADPDEDAPDEAPEALLAEDERPEPEEELEEPLL